MHVPDMKFMYLDCGMTNIMSSLILLPCNRHELNVDFRYDMISMVGMVHVHERNSF